MAKIYTKTGDRGETGLFDGTRVSKDDPRVAAYGDVDETNACIGAARAFVKDREVDALLLTIQKDLFTIGAQLADPKYGKKPRPEKFQLDPGRISEFEKAIDRWQGELEPLRGFILPCGSPSGALLHVARTVCRRAERAIVALARAHPVNPDVIVYVNRLSDLLFVLARVENRKAGEEQVKW
jgi:cob(I)alamin adenosyltransferase